MHLLICQVFWAFTCIILSSKGLLFKSWHQRMHFCWVFTWLKIQCSFPVVSFLCNNWMLTPCVTLGGGKKNVWRTKNVTQLRNCLKKVTLNLKRVSKYQDFSSKSFLSMYIIFYFNIMCCVLLIILVVIVTVISGCPLL